MANLEQLAILKAGVDTWNNWREENLGTRIDLSAADLGHAHLSGAQLSGTDLWKADLGGANLAESDLSDANLRGASLIGTFLHNTNLNGANLIEADLRGAHLNGSNFSGTKVSNTIFGNLDLSEAIGLESVFHVGPSRISTNVFVLSRGKIPEVFLRGCGLSDWEIESVKLYNPDLSNDEFTGIQNKIFLRNRQSLQISSLFISYSHADSAFVNKLESELNKNGIRFWRDVHDAKAGRLEKQIDRAMRLNPTVLLILSEHAIESDWVEHEVRTARALEKEIQRDVICPLALDDGWKNSRWPRRVMEQIMEYNILDFSAWRNDGEFENVFKKLVDGLDLFYK